MEKHVGSNKTFYVVAISLTFLLLMVPNVHFLISTQM